MKGSKLILIEIVVALKLFIHFNRNNILWNSQNHHSILQYVAHTYNKIAISPGNIGNATFIHSHSLWTQFSADFGRISLRWTPPLFSLSADIDTMPRQLPLPFNSWHISTAPTNAPQPNITASNSVVIRKAMFGFQWFIELQFIFKINIIFQLTVTSFRIIGWQW